MSKIVPVCSIIGHVDVGKTKLLDLMRSSSTEEASGITQQIGATMYNPDRLKVLSGNLSKHVNVDGLLMIDTPGHECFTAIRYVGMMVSDIVIILVDVFKGLQAETIRCLDYFKKNNKKVIFAVNKIDRLYGWKKTDKHRMLAIKNMLKKQDKNALDQLDTKLGEIKLQLAIQEINAELYYKNTDQKTFSNIVPISAETGEGIPDLIALISRIHKDKVQKTEMYGFVLDEREDSKNGKYYICIHKLGTIKRGDTIKLNGKKFTIKRLLVIKDQKEIKDSHNFKFTEEISEPCGFGLMVEEDSMFEPGTVYSDRNKSIKVYDTDDLEPYMKEFGLTIVAPSRILMDALVKSIDKEKINMAMTHVGKLDKITIIKSSKWIDMANDDFGRQYYQRYNTVLWFCPSNLEEKVDPEIAKYASEDKVQIIVANTIYSLIDKYNKYIEELDNKMRKKYPGVYSDVRLNIIPKYVFLKRTPLLFGVNVRKGMLYVGDELIVNDKRLGKVIGIKKDNSDVTSAEFNTDVCIKIDNPSHHEYEKDFTFEDEIQNFTSEKDMNLRYKYNISL